MATDPFLYANIVESYHITAQFDMLFHKVQTWKIEHMDYISLHFKTEVKGFKAKILLINWLLLILWPLNDEAYKPFYMNFSCHPDMFGVLYNDVVCIS